MPISDHLKILKCRGEADIRDKETEIRNIEDPRLREASRTDEGQMGDTRIEGAEGTDTTLAVVRDCDLLEKILFVTLKIVVEAVVQGLK